MSWKDRHTCVYMCMRAHMHAHMCVLEKDLLYFRLASNSWCFFLHLPSAVICRDVTIPDFDYCSKFQISQSTAPYKDNFQKNDIRNSFSSDIIFFYVCLLRQHITILKIDLEFTVQTRLTLHLKKSSSLSLQILSHCVQKLNHFPDYLILIFQKQSAFKVNLLCLFIF